MRVQASWQLQETSPDRDQCLVFQAEHLCPTLAAGGRRRKSPLLNSSHVLTPLQICPGLILVIGVYLKTNLYSASDVAPAENSDLKRWRIS